MNLFWNKRLETLSRDELFALQNDRLQHTIAHVYAHNPWYRQAMAQRGVTPSDIRTAADITMLPFMHKESFRETYPLGMCCVPTDQLREFHMSSGSTGTPVVMAYTENDLAQWADCMARCYRMAGMLPGDGIQITPTFGLFNGGFGFFHGARLAELFICPASSGNTNRQVKLLHDFNIKGIGGVVSYMARIMEVALAQQVELPALKIGIFGAETFSDTMRQKIESCFNIETFDIYGMTETGGVGTTGMDCPARCGIHVWEDHYILEIVDHETGEAVPDGNVGEVVFTALTREAIPVIRFRTGDISRIVGRQTCACGRTSARIDRITGRFDDMMIIKGVNFFPKQVEQALMEIPGVLPEYQIILENRDGIQDIHINVEAEDGVTGYTIEKYLKERLGFSPKGDVFKPGQLPRTEGKAQRVIRLG